MPTVAIISFRLGGPDGVSVEAAKWAAAFGRLGWEVRTVAGEGPADTIVPGLGIDPTGPPDPCDVRAALADADLVVVENLCSLPMNPAASAMVAGALAGRAAVLRHHDLPWQRARFAGINADIPDDPCWVHVTINDLSRRQLGQLGITATTIRNAFDTNAPAGDHDATRAALGLGVEDRLVVQPTRAIARKNIPAAVALAHAVGATFWLLGPAEEGYDAELGRVLDQARSVGVRCIHGPAGTPAAEDVAHAYAAADVVAFPSIWEGFGNPVVESAVYRRPLAIGRYPVADELAAFGFRWLDAADHRDVREWLARPDPALMDHNLEVARRWFSLPALDDALASLLVRAVPGWTR